MGDGMGIQVSDFTYVMRRLLIAFSDSSAAFEESRATATASGGRSARRFLEAFSDSAPAFGATGTASRAAGPAGTGASGARPHGPGRGTVAGLLGFGVLGAAFTTWTAVTAGVSAAGVVAVLTVAVLTLMLAAGAQPARVQAAPARSAGADLDVPATERPEERGPTFWNELEPAERRYVEETAHERVFAPGVPLLRQGYPADYVVIIRSGWAKVRVDRVGVERIVAVRGPGDLVGERALWRIPWSATVIALSAVRARVLTAEEFTGLVTRFPRLLAVLEEQVHERRLAEQPVIGARREVIDTEQRLAALFTTLSGARAGTLAVTDDVLAGWVSSSPTVIESVLTSWDRQGIVRPGSTAIDVLDPDRLERLTGGRETAEKASDAAPFSGGDNCTIIFTDVAGFGDLSRTEADRQLIRKVLDSLLEDAFDEGNVRWAACHQEDRGDGLLIVVPPGIPPSAVTGPLLERLGEKLSRYNGEAAETQRFRVRAAVHVGPVLADQDGVYGPALNHTAELLVAPGLGERLTASAADLGLIVSDTVHRTAAGRTAGYRRVGVRTGDGEVTAWTRLLPG